MKLNTTVKVEGNKVTLLFEEGDVLYNDRYWGKVDTILGFEYTVNDEGYVSTQIMVRDFNISRFPDRIRRHMTTEKIENFVIKGCDTDQEKYNALMKAGHNMRLISITPGKIKMLKMNRKSNPILKELRVLIKEKTCGVF